MGVIRGSYIRWLIVGVLLLVTTGSTESGEYRTQAEKRQMAKAVNNVLSRAGRQIEKRYNMKVVGTGSGSPMGRINTLILRLDKVGPLTIDEIRPLLVGTIDELVAQANANEIVASNLRSPPFKPADANVAIFIVDDRGRGLRCPNISGADNRDGELVYSCMPPGSVKLTHVYRESYADAKLKLQSMALGASRDEAPTIAIDIETASCPVSE